MVVEHYLVIVPVNGSKMSNMSSNKDREEMNFKVGSSMRLNLAENLANVHEIWITKEL